MQHKKNKGPQPEGKSNRPLFSHSDKKENIFRKSDDKPEQLDKEKTSPDPDTTRLNKYVAQCGIAARRKADLLIQQGHVKVNGKVETSSGYRVKAEDEVMFKGKVIRPTQNFVYFLMNKPKDCITTLNDEKGRRTVMDVIGNRIQERIFPVGRLDRATTGLLLLTNDGELAEKLSHPSHKMKKVYHVVLDKPVSEQDIEKIRKGLTLEDGLAPVDGVSHINNKPKDEVGIEIHIGRNRIVRRIFEHLGYKVKKLDRVLYAGLTKKDIPRGRFRQLTEKEIIFLKHFA